MTETVSTINTGAEEVAGGWLAEFRRALEQHDVDAIDGLFLTDGWWRDQLALTWDLRTLHGVEAIKTVLGERLEATGFTRIRLSEGKTPEIIEPDPSLQWVQAFFDFETRVARGRGVVRLLRDGDDWKAWTVLTAVQELKGHEMRHGARRPVGPTHGDGGRQNWLDHRRQAQEFAAGDPRVLVVGAGQGGLSIAASLGLLGVDTLVIEKNARVGDNWRNRYHSLVLHDPVWADHLPYLPFPDSWPVYTPKDKLGDWFEAYASSMELNVWTGTELLDAEYDDEAGRWTVLVRRSDGEQRTVHPGHVVLATGALGEPNAPRFEGTEDFKGTLHHSSAYRGGLDWAGRKAVVVGACNSGHDIAQDLHQHGAEVTIVQRSTTYVMSQTHGIPVLFGSLYYEGGPPTEDADLLNAAFPLPVALDFAKAQTQAIGELDRELLDGLERAGFRLDTGDDGGGLMAKALRRGGGYYIDVGCSQLIADGKVKVKSGSGIERFTEDGILFDDGTTLDADLVVLATGYANMRETARRLFGDAVADRCTPVWDLDEEGELNTIWRDSGHPGFWFMGGPLLMARIFSRPLALQIKAIEEGLITHPSATKRSAS